MLPGGLPGLGLPVHAPPAAHDPLDVFGRPGSPHRQEPFLGLRRRHARQLPDLGVGQLPKGQGLRQPGERAQGARHPHVLAGRAGCKPHAPAQPGGAGGEAVVPAAAGIELADEIEQARGGGVKVGGELGDLVAHPLQFRDGSEGHADGCRVDLHCGPPFYWSDSTPRFRSHLRASTAGDPGRAVIFRPLTSGRPSPGPCGPLSRLLVDTDDKQQLLFGEAVKRKSQAESWEPRDATA